MVERGQEGRLFLGRRVAGHFYLELPLRGPVEG
jgi:hypothetical protein